MIKKIVMSIGIFLLLILAISVYAARLPTVNGDNNAWGDVLNEYLQVAHDSGGNLKNSYISSAMIIDNTIANVDIGASAVNTTQILDATVGAIDIASAVVNTTHIVDATVGAIDIASAVVNTTHIVDATILGGDIFTNAALNITSIVIGGANRTLGGGPALVTNITGIFFNKTRLDIPSISAGACTTVYVNMSGIPLNLSCIPIADPVLHTTIGTLNITLSGTTSIADNCRILMCNSGGIAGGAVNPGNLEFGAFGIATGLDGTSAS